MVLFSARFGRPVAPTRHARERMSERGITEPELLAMIDEGGVRWADARRMWAYRHFPYRDDNLLCAVLVLEGAVVVKTVMHRFELEG